MFHRVIADKFQAEQTLSEKLKQFVSSLLENDKLLNDIAVFHCHFTHLGKRRFHQQHNWNNRNAIVTSRMLA